MKRRNRKDWRIYSLLALPLAAIAGGFLAWRRRRRTIPTKRALVPIDQEPQQPEALIAGGQPSIIPVTAARSPAESPAKMPARQGKDGGGNKGPVKEYSFPQHAPETGHALRDEPGSPISMLVLLVPFLILAVAIIATSFGKTPVQSQSVVPGGDPARGKAYIAQWGCGACHSIPGIAGANGEVGPNLAGIGSRSFIAGSLPNHPDNLVNWIMHPQQIVPGNGMPDMGIPEPVARDMAAYLYTLH